MPFSAKRGDVMRPIRPPNKWSDFFSVEQIKGDRHIIQVRPGNHYWPGYR